MANITGLITVNEKEVLEVDAVPSAGGGTAAPMGSLSMYDSGAAGFVYVKTGPLDTDWTAVSLGDAWLLTGNTLVGGEYMGSNNAQDVLFYYNSAEEMRLTSNALLVGLSAAVGGRLQIGETTADADVIAEIFDSANQVINVSRMSRLTTSGAVSANQDFAIPTDANATFESTVCARQTNAVVGAIGDGASYVRTCHARNLAGVVTMFGLQTDYTYEVIPQLNYTLTANGANIRGTVTGNTSRDLSWSLYSKLLIIGS